MITAPLIITIKYQMQYKVKQIEEKYIHYYMIQYSIQFEL